MTNPTSLPETTMDMEAQKREIAYRLWEEEGYPDGKAEEHWTKACLIVSNLEAEAIENPNWLRKQPDADPVQESASAPSTQNSFEESLQLLRKQIVGKSAA